VQIYIFIYVHIYTYVKTNLSDAKESVGLVANRQFSLVPNRQFSRVRLFPYLRVSFDTCVVPDRYETHRMPCVFRSFSAKEPCN